jgi:lysophospholipase L1-like esterase
VSVGGRAPRDAVAWKDRLRSIIVGRRRYALLIAGTAVALSSLTACGNKASPHAVSGHQQLSKGDQYVAIGDSYTSAPRIGPRTDRIGCLQTTDNYPHQVAKRLGLELTDVSCGGATTQQLTRPQLLGNVSQPPQIDALSRTTDLVTISLGANDFGIFGGVVFVCPAVRAKDPTGAPCTTANAAAGKNSVEHRVASLEKRLVAVIELVKKRAPKAQVVVVGYPQFFPAAGPCDQLPLADGDFSLAHKVNKELVDVQKTAAAKSKVKYVDVFDATKGHDMCSAEPWMAGLKPGRADAMPYHPLPQEQRAVTDLLVDLLN